MKTSKNVALVIEKVAADRKLSNPFVLFVYVAAATVGARVDVALSSVRKGSKLFAGAFGDYLAGAVVVLDGTGYGFAKAKKKLAASPHVVARTDLGAMLSSGRVPGGVGQAGRLCREAATEIAGSIFGGTVAARGELLLVPGEEPVFSGAAGENYVRVAIESGAAKKKAPAKKKAKS